MAKYTPQTFANLDNPGSATDALNYNFETLATLADLFVSRDGTAPNQMTANFDMNSHRILNLPVPVDYAEPARHGDIQTYVDEAEGYANDAEASKVAAAASEASALNYKNLTQALYDDFVARYIGAYSTAPQAEYDVGTLYFNTGSDNFYVFAEDDIHDVGDPVVVGDDLVTVGYWLPFPQATLLSLNDVDASGITSNQILRYSAGKFVNVSLTASMSGYTDTYNTGQTNVQDAVDYLVNQTNLTRYDVSFYLQGLMLDGETLFRYIPAQSVTFRATGGSTYYYAKAGTAATASTVLLLKKNGTQFGTVTFAASGTTGTFSISGDTSFAAGDLWTMEAPATADATLADVTFTFALLR